MEIAIRAEIKESDEKLKNLIEAYENYCTALLEFENTVNERVVPVWKVNR